MDIKDLVKLTARAWSVAILAEMARGAPGRQAPLIAATGAGRTAFAQSLSHLIELGLVERNPGHGHPLRPEFRLTEQGAAIAPMARRVEAALDQPGDRSLIQRAWSLPVLSVSLRPRYFGEIRRELPPITDRALSQSLKRLEDRQWVRRDADLTARPLRARYHAVNRGAEIGEMIAEAIA